MPASEGDVFLTKLKSLIEAGTPGMMLNRTICESYAAAKDAVAATPRIGVLVRCATEAGAGQGSPAVFTISIADFLRNPALQHEIFGPATLIVRGTLGEITAAVRGLEGQLTASIHASDEEAAANPALMHALRDRCGRLIYNGFPTGVEVCNSMVHGGPFPSTSDGRSTSVGTMAIHRFCRPAAWQSFPDTALPPELQDTNPLGIRRME